MRINNEPRRCQCHPDHLLQLKACQDLVHPHRQTLQSQRAQPRHQEIPFEFYLNKGKNKYLKVEKILKDSLDSIPSPSPSVKIQIMVG